MIFNIIEIILGSTSLICSAIMLFRFFTQPELQLFCYVLLVYAVLGTTLTNLAQLVYIIVNLCTDEQTSTWSCQLTGYLSAYGTLQLVFFLWVTIHILKMAVVQQNQQDLAGNMDRLGIAFFGPIVFTILPLMNNTLLYGDSDKDDLSLCWLNMASRRKSLMAMLSFYTPLIVMSVLSLNDSRIIIRRINFYSSQRKKDDQNVEKINQLMKVRNFAIMPLWLLCNWGLTLIIYSLEKVAFNFEVALQITQLMTLSSGTILLITVLLSTNASNFQKINRVSTIYNLDFFALFYQLKSVSTDSILGQLQKESS